MAHTDNQRHRKSELHITESGFKRARDLKIGDRFGQPDKATDEAPRIKRLHELCAQQMTPHVHVVTSRDSFCLPFNRPV